MIAAHIADGWRDLLPSISRLLPLRLSDGILFFLLA